MPPAFKAKGWRILVFHSFTSATPTDLYTYPAGEFSAVLDAIAASGISNVTIGQGIGRLRCQGQ